MFLGYDRVCNILHTRVYVTKLGSYIVLLGLSFKAGRNTNLNTFLSCFDDGDCHHILFVYMKLYTFDSKLYYFALLLEPHDI